MCHEPAIPARASPTAYASCRDINHWHDPAVARTQRQRVDSENLEFKLKFKFCQSSAEPDTWNTCAIFMAQFSAWSACVGSSFRYHQHGPSETHLQQTYTQRDGREKVPARPAAIHEPDRQLD